MNTSTTIEVAAGQDWEARWSSAEGTFDPAYERANAALRRWVDGMEQALLATSASPRRDRPVVARSLTTNPTPHRR